MPGAIIFDGEGVIIDSESLWDRSQEEFLARRGLTYDRAKIKPLLTGRSLVEGVEILRQEYGLHGDAHALAEERLEIMRGFLEHDVRFIPGFVNFFAEVHAEFKTCIATVMPKRLLDAVVDRLDLRRYFGDRIYDPESLSLPAKPAPDLFLYAARQLQVTPAHCVVIEDSPNGIEAARRAGMRCIGLGTTFTTEALIGADFVAPAFDAGLVKYVRSLSTP